MRAAILIGLVASPCAMSAPGAKDAPPPKQSPLVGEWVAVRQTQDGRELPWTLDGTVYAFTADGKWACYEPSYPKAKEKALWSPYRADDKADPPTLDILSKADVKGADKTASRWLYKIDGDTLSICMYSDDGRIRPKEFEARKGSKNWILHFTRVKPAPGAKGAPPPLEGEWLLVNYTPQGRVVPFKLHGRIYTFTADGKYAFYDFDDESSLQKAKKNATWDKYRVEEKADPPTIDIIRASDKAAERPERWIYKIDGDSLSICTNSEKPTVRPTEFQALKGSPNLILYFKHVKPEEKK